MACSFNGTSQYLTIPVNSALEFGTGDFTVAYQINISSFSGKNNDPGICLGQGANGGSGGNQVNCGWWLRTSSSAVLWLRYDGTTYTELSKPFAFATNTPYCIVCSRQGTSLRLFVNGEQQGTAFTSALSFNRVATGGSQDLHIGRFFSGSAVGDPVSGATYYTFWTNGLISEIGIWKAGLTDSEITALSRGFTTDQIRPQSLSFYAPLVRNFQDVRGGLAITNNNAATVATHPRIYT